MESILAVSIPIAIVIVTLIIFIIGVAGIVLPVIPGLPIVWAGVLFYGIVTDFAEITPTIVIITGVLAAAGVLLEFVANALGAKIYGASWWGVTGAILGGLVGLILLNIPGIFIGSFAGAFIGEYLKNKKIHSAAKAGVGTIIGIIFGTVTKVIILFFMLGIFIWGLF